MSSFVPIFLASPARYVLPVWSCPYADLLFGSMPAYRSSVCKRYARQAGSISTSTSSVRRTSVSPSLIPFLLRSSAASFALSSDPNPDISRSTPFPFIWSDLPVTRPFTPLLPYETVLGMEASPDSRRTALEPAGLFLPFLTSSSSLLFARHQALKLNLLSFLDRSLTIK